MELDDTDRAILHVLHRDGRISNDALARQVGLSPSPCSRRLRRLERAGVIRGYIADIDPRAVGRGLRCFVGVRLSRQNAEDCATFEAQVRRLPEVVESHHVTGDYDYLLRVEVADLPAYRDFHTNRLARLHAVNAVTTYVVMATLQPDPA